MSKSDVGVFYNKNVRKNKEKNDETRKEKNLFAWRMYYQGS